MVSVNYDMLGRRISLESLDMGRKEWNYNRNGLLESETDSVLRAKQAAIKYEYDGLDRIIKIDYPLVRILVMNMERQGKLVLAR